jgi:uncharacterized membrane protein HdeD (DUF308 family)
MSIGSLGTAEQIFGEVRRNWGWLLALGVLSIVLGTIGLGTVFALTLAGVLVFGWLILIGGGIELVQAFKCHGWQSRLWQLVVAALHVAAGILILADPLLASGVITLFLGAAILAGGVVRILVAFQHRDHAGWGWLVFSGVVSLVLGAMILSRWPASSFFVIGLFIAIELIFNGWSLVTLALAARAASGTPSAGRPA